MAHDLFIEASRVRNFLSCVRLRPINIYLQLKKFPLEEVFPMQIFAEFLNEIAVKQQIFAKEILSRDT